MPGHPPRQGLRTPAASARTWPLWLAFPLDALGLYLVLASFAIIPSTWPATEIGAWGTWLGTVAFCGLARIIALRALRGSLLKPPHRSLA